MYAFQAADAAALGRAVRLLGAFAGDAFALGVVPGAVIDSSPIGPTDSWDLVAEFGVEAAFDCDFFVVLEAGIVVVKRKLSALS